MNNLWIFNPDTEFALASGSPFYTPPRSIIKLRQQMALFPVVFADTSDAIMIMDGDETEQQKIAPQYYSMAIERGIRIFSCLSQANWEEFIASPWGWNPMMRKWLIDNCPSLTGILSDTEIDAIRKLAHRNTTIRFIEMLPPLLKQDINLPIELHDANEATEYYHKNPNLFIKAPWSSSGRGVMRTDDLLPLHVEPWIKGTIRSQGSVIIEPIYEKVLDFASEWYVMEGKVEYLGLSVFEASNRGKYHKNIIGTQKELLTIITSRSPYFNSEIFEAQRMAIERLIAPYYSGPIGIDMMVLRDGKIHPCVEINVRHTMGSVLINNQNCFST